MATATVRMANVYTVFDSANQQPFNLSYGDGSNYTYRLTGDAGDTATAYGGYDEDAPEDFVPIITLTIEADGLPVRGTVQHAFPVLRLDYTGHLMIARST